MVTVRRFTWPPWMCFPTSPGPGVCCVGGLLTARRAALFLLGATVRRARSINALGFRMLFHMITVFGPFWRQRDEGSSRVRCEVPRSPYERTMMPFQASGGTHLVHLRRCTRQDMFEGCAGSNIAAHLHLVAAYGSLATRCPIPADPETGPWGER